MERFYGKYYYEIGNEIVACKILYYLTMQK